MKVKALEHERLFEPFLDEVDGVACVASDATADEVAGLVSPHGLRFPLWLDPALPLHYNVAAGECAPASSRFGPYCDNITGMNWELRNGRVVRVGERVVKSTTGYDLLRFLLGSGDRFGRARDFVLRLRPLCARDGAFFLTGSEGDLEKAVSEILHGPYLHWLECVDWLVGDRSAPQLRVGVHCPSEEWPVFMKWSSRLAETHRLDLAERPGTAPDGLPDLAFKTTPDGVIPLCGELERMADIRCTGLCYPGVVHVYFQGVAEPAERVQSVVSQVAGRLEERGGHWMSRHAAQPLRGEEEDRWVRGLLTEWEDAR